MAFGEKRNLNIVVEPYNDEIFFNQQNDASNLAHTRSGFLVRKIILINFFPIASAMFHKARALLLYNNPGPYNALNLSSRNV